VSECQVDTFVNINIPLHLSRLTTENIELDARNEGTPKYIIGSRKLIICKKYNLYGTYYFLILLINILHLNLIDRIQSVLKIIEL